MKKIILLMSSLIMTSTAYAKDIKVLAFSQVEPGIYHHLSNLNGIALIERLGKKQGWKVDVTHDSGSFNDKRLSQYDVVAFINSTGDILNDEQQASFERYIRNGGGYVGTHSAADTEHGWEWYGKLVGGFFRSHPDTDQVGETSLENKNHPALKHVQETVPVLEEWYDYTSNVRGKPGYTVLMTVDENTYEGGVTGDDHPITWVNEFDGGRAFYTGFGHYFQKDHPFLSELLIGGVEWAAGE
ncbi:ThuA domain-containing protein [Pseudemcibacter aquimaris]|uniref:ThuA domain-containing protein n=1 Tax=Pseudemcibacter aquimaris TaxID=2857064 RepID=UPI0020121D05|nr:ThuA domain-containing protein [Pseudemcibacter aquimaris]MCC3862570.1 ThuA domain-containing protein [Pseudemcibacter aquimaris]WDU57912.1 ThuA domain-containing protein [Pseudemcibacter aquimaris]